MTAMTMPAMAPPDNPPDDFPGTNVEFAEAAGTGWKNAVVTVGEKVEVTMTPVIEVPLVPAVAVASVTVYTTALVVQVPALQY